jgi:hypothetical protein
MSDLRLLSFILLAGLTLFGCRNAAGWAHAPISDPDLVQHSDLIVVARVEPDSIVFIRNAQDNSWKHTAVLIVEQVIKGKSNSDTLPVIFYYGMDPISIGGHGEFQGLSKAQADPNSQIVMGYQGGRYGRVPGDLRKDHIWFLRYPPSPAHPTDPHEGLNILGVSEPEELQPVELAPYFDAFLTPKPEDVLKNYASGDSSLALRSKIYLNHLAIAQILQEPDVQKRANLLLPYFLFTDENKIPPDEGEAAFQLWESCKQTGAALLLPYFANPKYRAMQTSIMSLWANAQYHGGIPLLNDLLDKETQFWQSQSPEERDRWINMRQDHGPTSEQIASMRRIEMILFVFRQVPDPRAKAEIQKVSPIWKQMFPGDSGRSLGQEINEGLMIPGA